MMTENPITPCDRSWWGIDGRCHNWPTEMVDEMYASFLAGFEAGVKLLTNDINEHTFDSQNAD